MVPCSIPWGFSAETHRSRVLEASVCGGKRRDDHIVHQTVAVIIETVTDLWSADLWVSGPTVGVVRNAVSIRVDGAPSEECQCNHGLSREATHRVRLALVRFSAPLSLQRSVGVSGTSTRSASPVWSWPSTWSSPMPTFFLALAIRTGHAR